MKIIYLANVRLPTEKAHGLQIMENCHALAQTGAQVTLWAAHRWDRGVLAGRDPFVHYGLPRSFRLRRLPTLDLLGLVPGQDNALSRFIFGVQTITYLLAALIALLIGERDAVCYSRDERVIALLGAVVPRHRLAYEPHSLAHGRIGRVLQRRACHRAGVIFPVTGLLADDLAGRGADRSRMHIAPDGIRADRFADPPDRATARWAFGWPEDAFIVGYVGRLHTMNMGKGVDVLVTALAGLPGIALALVGGPDETAAELRAAWIALGGDADRFLTAGQIAPDRVPAALAAFDVCAMPLPYTEHFARHASPLKLFEYMAARRAIVASALPSFAEIVTDDETALLVPPSVVPALTAAVLRLHADADLRARLAAAAGDLVFEHYTWDARARLILTHLGETH